MPSQIEIIPKISFLQKEIIFFHVQGDVSASYFLLVITWSDFFGGYTLAKMSKGHADKVDTILLFSPEKVDTGSDAK